MVKLRRNPVLLCGVLSLAVFLFEIVAMLLTKAFPVSTLWAEILVDSTLLMLMLCPILYFLMLRPLSRLMAEEATAKEQESIVRSEVSYIEIALQEANTDLRRFNLLFYILSQVNQAVARATDEESFLAEVCRILAASGELSRGWIGLVDDGTPRTLRPAAHFGFAAGLQPLDLESEGLPHEHPAAAALRTGELCIEQPKANDEVPTMALPLWGAERMYGVLTVHAARPAAFQVKERELFTELAGDVGLAIVSLRERAERVRTHEQIERLGSLKEYLLGSDELATKLQRIADGMVEFFDGDFARVWMTGEGDRCESTCAHAAATQGPHVCRDRGRCLHLIASAGRYTHIDGAHGRVPLGCYKIGQIAAGDISQLLSNDVRNDPRIHDREWARQLGLVSFAGFRLLSPDGTAIGVLAMFGKRALAPHEQRMIEDIANTTSQVMLSGAAEEALRESEGKLRTILEGCPIPQFVIDRNHRVISWNRPLEALIGVQASAVLGTTGHQAAFRKQPQPTLADLLMDGALDDIRERYGEPSDPSALDKGMYNVTSHLPDAGSGGMWLNLTTAVIYDSRKVAIGAVETLEDITEQRRIDEELRRSRFDLEQRIATRTRDLAVSNTVLQFEVEQRKQVEEALLKAHHEAESLLTSLSSFLIGVNAELRITRWNAAAETTFGLSVEKANGKSLEEVAISWDWMVIADGFAAASQSAQTVSLPEVAYTAPDGKERFVSITIDCLRNPAGETEAFTLLGTDVTDRRELQLQLVQAQKLESIGQLAAGIAHEINTPTQYVGDNLEFLQEAFRRLNRLLPQYTELLAAAETAGISSELPRTLRALVEEIRLDYLLTQIPRAIEQSLEGTTRVSKIVQAMKEFSHPGTVEKMAVDINRAIESTITVARNEWKYVAEVVTELDPNLPLVPCLPGEFNQVVLNLIVNAAHAIADTASKDGQEAKGLISLMTRREGDWVELRIGDTGSGIPDEIRHRVFDPFFTTKPVGKGTGQGLAIARSVIVDKHGGRITFESETGKGTTFIIQLPIRESV